MIKEEKKIKIDEGKKKKHFNYKGKERKCCTGKGKKSDGSQTHRGKKLTGKKRGKKRSRKKVNEFR